MNSFDRILASEDFSTQAEKLSGPGVL